MLVCLLFICTNCKKGKYCIKLYEQRERDSDTQLVEKVNCDAVISILCDARTPVQCIVRQSAHSTLQHTIRCMDIFWPDG